MIAPRLFHIMTFFCNPELVKWDICQPMESRDSIGLFTGHEALHIGRVESHYTREGCRKNEKLLKKEKKKKGLSW